MKAIQRFSKEYLDQCKNLSTEEIVDFIEGFRELNSGVSKKSRLISIKIPENLLEAFKLKAKLEDVPYQTKIKELMSEWLKK